ncbi:MAG: M20/M25/M40 family metallo-hydrolase [Promethearchaeota archaeon]
MVSSEFQEIENESIISLMSHLKAISIPRFVGSKGEKQTQVWLKDQIQKLGYKPFTEPIPTTLFRINFLQGLTNFIVSLMLILSAYLFSIHPLLILITITLVVIDIILISTGSVGILQAPDIPNYWKKKMIETENIWAETPKIEDNKDRNEDRNKEIVFMGHYDSKSTVITGIQRVASYNIMLLCVVIVLFSGLAGIIFHFIYSQGIPVIQSILWVSAIVGAAFGLLLTFNVAGNKSPGAADNGTAAVILLEAMKYFKKHPVEGANITFLFSAAEEIGLTGAYYFCKNREGTSGWEKDNVYAINFDMAGSKGEIVLNEAIGIPKKECSPYLNMLVENIAQEQQIKIKKLYLPIGAWTDALPFIEKEYKTATFLGISKLIHSNKDKLETIDEYNLFNSFVLGVELAKKIMEES